MGCFVFDKRWTALAVVLVLISMAAGEVEAKSKSGGNKQPPKRGEVCTAAKRTALREAGFEAQLIEAHCSGNGSSGSSAASASKVFAIQQFETEVNTENDAQGYVETLKEYGCGKVTVATDRREGILWALVYSQDCVLRLADQPCPNGPGWSIPQEEPGPLQRFAIRAAGTSLAEGGREYPISLCLSKEVAARNAAGTFRPEKAKRATGTSP